MKYTHKIAVVSGADLDNNEHFVIASNRTQRAIKKARLLRQQNPNVMLFRIAENGDKKPISLKHTPIKKYKDFNCNAPFISNEIIPLDKESGRRKRNV